LNSRRLVQKNLAVRESLKKFKMRSLAIVCVLALAGCVSCQSCLNCNSTATPMCADPMTSANQQTLITGGFTCSANACQKQSYQAGGPTIVIRSCSNGNQINTCITANLFGYGGSQCNCYGSNYCNAARPTVVPAMFTATLLFAAALMLAKFSA